MVDLKWKLETTWCWPPRWIVESVNNEVKWAGSKWSEPRWPVELTAIKVFDRPASKPKPRYNVAPETPLSPTSLPLPKKKRFKGPRKLEEGSRKCRDNIGHEAFDVERSQFDIYFKSNNGFNRNDPISFCTTVNFSKEGFYLCEPLTTTCRSISVPKSLPLPISFAIPYPSFLATVIGSWNWETRCSKCLPYFPWKIGQRFVMEKPRP